MAKVSDIIFCLNATNLPGQGVCANTILSAITPEYIPGLYTFSVVITILGIDTSVDHSIGLSFSTKDDVIANVEGPIPAMEEHSNLPLEYKGVNLTVDWSNINFKTDGEYCLKVAVDGAVIGNKTIYVKGKNQT